MVDEPISQSASAKQAADRAAQADARFARERNRPDSTQMQRQEAQRLHDEDPVKNPAPQQGMSSSELNSASPAQKAKATDEAKQQ